MRIPEHIVPCLLEYGNTVISHKNLKRIGEQVLIEKLREKGLICEVEEVLNFTDGIRAGAEATMVINLVERRSPSV